MAPFACSCPNSGWGAAAQGSGTFVSFSAIAFSGAAAPWAATAAPLPMRHDRADSEHSSLDPHESWPVLGNLQQAAAEVTSSHREASGQDTDRRNVAAAVPPRRRRRPLSMRNSNAPSVAEKVLVPEPACAKRLKREGQADRSAVPSTSRSRCTFEWETYDFGGVVCDGAPAERRLDEPTVDQVGGKEVKVATPTDIFDFENW